MSTNETEDGTEAERPTTSGTVSRRALRKIKEELKCSVCLELLTDPRLLPCHHSFCLRCLEGIQQQSHWVIRCPNCTEEFGIRGHVSGLPRDFRANSLLDCLPAIQPENNNTVVSKPPLSSADTFLGRVTCPVCKNIYDEPRKLECGHTFCTDCLEFMEPMNGSIIHCPCCDGQTDVSAGVRALSIDTAKVDYIEAVSERAQEEDDMLDLSPPSSPTPSSSLLPSRAVEPARIGSSQSMHGETQAPVRHHEGQGSEHSVNQSASRRQPVSGNADNQPTSRRQTASRNASNQSTPRMQPRSENAGIHSAPSSQDRSGNSGNQPTPRRHPGPRNPENQEASERQARSQNQSTPRRRHRSDTDNNQSTPRRQPNSNNDINQSTPRRQPRSDNQSTPRRQPRSDNQSTPRRQPRSDNQSTPRRQPRLDNDNQSTPRRYRGIPNQTVGRRDNRVENQSNSTTHQESINSGSQSASRNHQEADSESQSDLNIRQRSGNRESQSTLPRQNRRSVLRNQRLENLDSESGYQWSDISGSQSAPIDYYRADDYDGQTASAFRPDTPDTPARQYRSEETDGELSFDRYHRGLEDLELPLPSRTFWQMPTLTAGFENHNETPLSRFIQNGYQMPDHRMPPESDSDESDMPTPSESPRRGFAESSYAAPFGQLCSGHQHSIARLMAGIMAQQRFNDYRARFLGPRFHSGRSPRVSSERPIYENPHSNIYWRH